ncbi:MAG: hypothetical protein IKV46_00805 [Bacteroidales bacterium]|jgi:hypothetical protein|nr:hypothetical protein [Bacteroidales bacterium]
MDFTSKLSLYDILTQLISGFLILALFIPESTSLQENWIFVIIFSYLIGIIYHRFLEYIRRVIACILEDKKGIRKLKTIFIRNANEAIKKAKEKIYRTEYDAINEEEIKEEYIRTYYSIMNKPCYTNISTLEAQEAFLRNITLILLAYIVVFCCECSYCECSCCNCCCNHDYSIGVEYILYLKKYISNCCCFCFGVVLFLFSILFARYHTQMKVYKAVWEAGKY